ncbi:MAG: hypothetical protein JNK04_20825 [Myxococcales bacterium]|nr:hypothetical protein [Myxococcales bacterium]
MRQPLVEGIDFYMEGDRFVFTADYHRKRGYCCNSSVRGCRHCPYKNAPEGEAPPVDESSPKR